MTEVASTHAAIGLRDVVAMTTLQAQQGDGFDQLFGWGIPDAELAVQAVLGKVMGCQPNRLDQESRRFHGG